jgi:hypothetical protein
VAPAAADPVLPRVVTAPTAWILPEGAAYGTAGLDHRGKGALDVGYGLGGIAAVELGADTDVRECAPCDTRSLAHAAFRIGARRDGWRPALALDTLLTIGQTPRVAELRLLASHVVGPLRLHAGVKALEARSAAGSVLGPTIRPLGAIELIPPQYPKTTLMADFSWLPRLDPALEWVFSWGVRYQALHWGSIELDVRHRENEGLAGSTVMVRVNGVWSRKRPNARPVRTRAPRRSRTA